MAQSNFDASHKAVSRPKALTERKNMISSVDAFSIFRKWKEDSSSVQLLTGSVQDVPTLRAPRRLARVVEVSEPKEIVLVVEGKGAHRASVNLCGASFEYADPRETSEPASRVWVCFIEANLPSGQRWLFGERNRS